MMQPRPVLEQTPYEAYSYSYPHKTAYRPLEPPVSLQEVWATENRQALFLYFHIPFCEMRCGFCNLFTTANPDDDLPETYLRTLKRQAERVWAALGPAVFARMAIGGGTPTYLSPAQLDFLFDIAEDLFGINAHRIPVSVETSPLTSEMEKLRVLRARGVDRISMGVQSFVEAETAAVGRRQKNADLFHALDRLAQAGFPTRNLDLIYGLPGQTVASWLVSVQTALRFAPEELYLYPLYIRPLTGLGRKDTHWNDVRLDCYREARSLLLSEGYEQLSMRMFRKKGVSLESGPVYCCQEDGMVGLGCGARSYTSGLHYSNEYAVGVPAVRSILADYLTRHDATFDMASYGIRLSAEDQRRRFVIQSLLQTEGLDLNRYQARFGTEVWADLPQLKLLQEAGLIHQRAETVQLTASGLERSDVIGPWLYSESVRSLMEGCEHR
ncbi:MAG: STM4012 family radical SAM protein [Blastocatellia bacterium]|nr:STM4012 family radical SAM protein [Blastocatellia bacterium]